ncbi:hypothetical protein SRHO_G00302860 [Serrasalmus rhombeus]
MQKKAASPRDKVPGPLVASASLGASCDESLRAQEVTLKCVYTCVYGGLRALGAQRHRTRLIQIVSSGSGATVKPEPSLIIAHNQTPVSRNESTSAGLSRNIQAQTPLH